MNKIPDGWNAPAGPSCIDCRVELDDHSAQAHNHRKRVHAGTPCRTERTTNEDRAEALNRAGVVRSILERCLAELGNVQVIPHLSADDVNELGAAKGFCERAIAALGRLPL